MEAVRCIRLGELRGLVPIPYVALQDTRHEHGFATWPRVRAVFAVAVCMVACAPSTMTTPNPERDGPTLPACSPLADTTRRRTAPAQDIRSDRTTFRDIGSLVGSHSHLDEIFPSRLIRKAPVRSRLAQIAEPRITYEFEGAPLTLDDYVARTPTTGLLVARESTILVERYQYGRTDRHRFASASMAKTVTAMLVGIAIAEGHPLDR